MYEVTPEPDPSSANELYSGSEGSAGMAPIIIKSGLKLNQERERWLVDRTIQRINEVNDEMGVVRGQFPTAQGWMWNRQNYQDQYENNWRWREQLGGIFEYSNWSLNIAKRFARLLHAKGSDDLLGTSPFFTAMPKKNANTNLSIQAEWFIQEKIDESNFADTVMAGMRGSLIRGESVMKSTFEFKASRFVGPAVVLIDPSGQPVITPKGNFIYQKDDILPDPNIEGVFRLKKEPSFQLPPAPAQFKFFDALTQTDVEYEGLGLDQVFYKDFGCPLKTGDIYSADINFQAFDEDYETLKLRYANIPTANNYFNNGYMSGKQQPNEKRGEELNSPGRDRQIVNCVDAYIRCDADEDGVAEEIWITLDITNERAIWFDYLKNHMERRPFGVLRGVEEVEGRWYGVGVFEMLDHKQLFVDTQFNRQNWKSSKASSMRFINKTSVKQWKNGQQPVVGDDQFFEIDDPMFNKDLPPAFEVRFGESDPVGMELMQAQMQAAATEVGVIGPNDGQMAGLDSTKLATGIRALERTGNQLQKATEKIQAKDIVNLLDLSFDTILSNMDEEELIYRKDTDQLLELSREEIRRLDRDIKLTLSRTRSTETLENSAAVINIINQFYDIRSQDPYRAKKMHPEYIRQLKALEVQDADELLDEVTDEEIKAFNEAKANEKIKPNEPTRSVSAKLNELAPSERAQALAQQGIQAAPPEELAQMKAEEDNRKLQEEINKKMLDAPPLPKPGEKEQPEGQ